MRALSLFTILFFSVSLLANDDCGDSARALLAMEQFFDGSDTMVVKQEKAILLAAVFSIDMDCFEDSGDD